MSDKPTIDATSQEENAPISQAAKADQRVETAAKPDDSASSVAAAQTAPSGTEQSQTALPQKTATATVAAHHPKKHHRTLGLRLFDGGAYAVIINTAVMAASIATTYLTQHGHPNNVFRKRGDQVKGFLMKKGMGEDTAKMTNAVFWSFTDGTLLSPLTKMLEDNRIKIAHGIDRALGTEPQDQSVYKEEPKQSWLSVIGGRLAVLSAVLPTAFFFEYFPRGKHTETIKGQEVIKSNNLNYTLFEKQGRKLGEAIEKRPNLAHYFGKLHIPGLMSIAIFEAVYTTICTTGLYFVSRNFANKIEHRKEEKAEKIHQTGGTGDAPTKPATAAETPAQPSQKVSEAQHMERLAADLSPQQFPA